MQTNLRYGGPLLPFHINYYMVYRGFHFNYGFLMEFIVLLHFIYCPSALFSPNRLSILHRPPNTYAIALWMFKHVGVMQPQLHCSPYKPYMDNVACEIFYASVFGLMCGCVLFNVVLDGHVVWLKQYRKQIISYQGERDLPSTITTHSVSASPCSFEATHR